MQSNGTKKINRRTPRNLSSAPERQRASRVRCSDTVPRETDRVAANVTDERDGLENEIVKCAVLTGKNVRFGLVGCSITVNGRSGRTELAVYHSRGVRPLCDNSFTKTILNKTYQYTDVSMIHIAIIGPFL